MSDQPLRVGSGFCVNAIALWAERWLWTVHGYERTVLRTGCTSNGYKK